jgi:outer membrane protein TolC
MVQRIVVQLACFLMFFSARGQEKTLQYYISAGLKNSPLLADLHNQLRSNAVDSLLLHASNKPQVGFKGYAYYAPIVNDFGYSSVLTNIANLTSVINVSQQIFNKKTREVNYSRISIQNQSISAAGRLTAMELKKNINAAYLDAWSTASEIAFDKEQLAFSKEEGKMLKDLAEQGIYKQTDYLSFGIDIMGQELSIQGQEIQLQKQLSDLNILCGIRDTAKVTMVRPVLGEMPAPKSELSPFFQRFRVDSLRIKNEQSLVDRNYKPTLSWFSDAGLINNDPRVIYQNFGLSFGLNFTLPVYDGNQRKLKYLQLNMEEESRKNYAAAFAQEYDNHKRQLLDELKMTKEQLPGLELQEKNAGLLIREEKDLVRMGAASITDYLNAIKNYLSIHRSLNQYEVRLLQIQNEINFWNQ